jgi:hypothetical protein
VEREGTDFVGDDLDRGSLPRKHSLLDPERVDREAVLAVDARQLELRGLALAQGDLRRSKASVRNGELDLGRSRMGSGQGQEQGKG